ncbi:MAG: OmpA family protein [Pseudomonadota bacterium]
MAPQPHGSLMRQIVILCVILASVAVVSFLFGREAAVRLENEVQRRAEVALSAAGLNWPRIATDGLMVTVRGEAPNAERQAEALARIESAIMGLPLSDESTVRPALQRYRPDPMVEILRGISALTLAGAVPGAEIQAQLTAALRKAAPGVTITDLTRTDAAGRGWDEIVPDAADIAAALLHGRIILRPGKVTVLGLAAGDARQAAISDRMAALEAAGWKVTSYLATPPQSQTQRVLHLESGPDGLNVIQCTATSPAQAEALEEELRSVLEVDAECSYGSADEDAVWGEVATLAINAMAAIGQGEIRLSASSVRVLAEPNTSEQTFAVASAALRTSLPPGFSLVVLRAAERGTGEASGGAGQEEALLNIAFNGEIVTLSGAAPSAVLAQSIAAFTRALMPGISVRNDVTIRTDMRPRDWRTAAMTLISALAGLESGTGYFDTEVAVLEGTIAAPTQIMQTHDLLMTGLGATRKITTRLTVPMAARSRAQKIPPIRCAEELSAITALNPIVFDTGSTQIGADSLAVISDLVETMRRCSEGRIEIGGHTDSQGSEATNLRISRARAEAVMAAMTVGGASLSQLTARGFGESEPIASNGTEEGRAANRRIEFRALSAAGKED